MEHELTRHYTDAAAATLKRLAKRNPAVAQQVNGAIKKYTAKPAQLLAEATRIVGTDQYRFRAGDWRVVFEFDDNNAPTAITITAIGHRKDVYR